jgi:TetR/AcrR family transcriptional repressor of nem operon
MDAANELIWHHSYGSVTIDAICERAGVKKGSFYYFFESKSDLALAAVDGWWERRRALIEEKFSPEIPPLDRLRGYLDFVAQCQLQAYELTGHMLGCPLFTLGSEISSQSEPIRLRIQEILRISSGYMEQAVADAQAAGEIEKGDPALKARFILCYYEGLLTRARIENDPEIARHFSSDVLQVIGVSPATASRRFPVGLAI